MNDTKPQRGPNEPHRSIDHSLAEDAMAFLVGTVMAAMSVTLLTHLGLITGQTAGLGVLLSYVSGWSFGAVFFVLNLPFYILGYLRLGWVFSVKSFIAVAMVSTLTQVMPDLLRLDFLHPVFGAFLAGTMAGLGLMVLFRHGASLGGVGVLGLVMQERLGIRAGWVQLGFDIALFGVAALVLPPSLVVLSLMGAVVTNLIIGVNHRQDRYIAR